MKKVPGVWAFGVQALGIQNLVAWDVLLKE